MTIQTFAVGVICAALAGWGAAAAESDRVDLFTSGQGGYHTYRIPAMVATPKGSVLVFAEGRKAGRGDAGDIDMVVKRSDDGGRTFGPPQVVWDDGANTCGNPSPVIDRATGTVWLLMTANPGKASEADIDARKPGATRTVWVTHSEDDGRTWAKPVDITATVKPPGWTWYATGPGAGIQTQSGRLVIPCDHKRGRDEGFAHVIYSDDGGRTWAVGGTAGPNTNESRVVELTDGRLMLNMRNYGIKDAAKRGRAISTSSDGGRTWSAVSHDATLVEPICQASLVRGLQTAEGKATYLFANPASAKREKMTLRLSSDDCATWPRSKELYAGPSAYSDVAVLSDGTILCVYERGEKSPYERVVLERFSLDAMK